MKIRSRLDYRRCTVLPQRSVPKETECTILLGRALAPVEQIVGSWKALVEGRAALRRLRELLETVAAQPERMALPPPEGALEASGLILRSGLGDRLILAGMSLNLAVGESLAVIGPSGAGKSSLVRVLGGLWRSHGGSVRLDGVDLSACDRAWLGPHIGYVPQDVKLSAGTVAENIARLGEVEGAAVAASARAAGIHEMILALPQGYDTPLGTAGPLLSPASASTSPWHGPCTVSRGCCCWTSPTPTSTAPVNWPSVRPSLR